MTAEQERALRKKKQAKNIQEINELNKKAKDAGMSYGIYVATLAMAQENRRKQSEESATQ